MKIVYYRKKKLKIKVSEEAAYEALKPFDGVSINPKAILINVMSAIVMIVESLKRIILDKSNEKLVLPVIPPVESLEGITE